MPTAVEVNNDRGGEGVPRRASGCRKMHGILKQKTTKLIP